MCVCPCRGEGREKEKLDLSVGIHFKTEGKIRISYDYLCYYLRWKIIDTASNSIRKLCYIKTQLPLSRKRLPIY